MFVYPVVLYLQTVLTVNVLKQTRTHMDSSMFFRKNISDFKS